MEINRGSRLLLTLLFQLVAKERFDGHFKTDYGGKGLKRLLAASDMGVLRASRLCKLLHRCNFSGITAEVRWSRRRIRPHGLYGTVFFCDQTHNGRTSVSHKAVLLSQCSASAHKK
ncbi:hypothetical protein KIL84_007620 [Mauremys mutica]|uniref:Secreted protein n=1 Tax=Mauremys mutica TaxID=74926 RepID=A0A9D4AQ77_9SAUR|nr:hypothetical protein KIL84_007620 [Mauremys mutica]